MKRLNQLFYPLAGFCEQRLVFVERFAELQQALEGTVECKSVRDGDRAEVIDHHFDCGAGSKGADREAFPFLHEAQRCRPVFKILRGSRFMAEAATLRVGRDPAVHFLQIDRPPDVVGKHCVTGAAVDCE